MSERLITTADGSTGRGFGAVEWGLLAATALIWGSAYLFIEIGLEGLEPTAIALLRVAIGLSLLAAIPAARAGKVAGRDRARIAVLGAFWLAIPLTLYPIAQESVSSSVAGMITGAQPLLAALIAALLLRRSPVGAQLAGLALGFAGIVLVVVSTADDGGASSALGSCLILVAVACYALSTNLAVPLQQRYGSLPVIFRALAFAAILLLVPGVFGLAASEGGTGSLLAMLPLGLLSTGVGYLTFTALLGRAGAARGATAIYFVPVVAIALGAIFRGETVGPLALAGTAAVLVGVLITARAGRS